MQELVNLETFALTIHRLALLLPVLGLAGGCLIGLWRRSLADGAVKGLAVGLVGPVIWLLWLLFAHLVRYDPQTGYCGLHRTAVLWLSMAVFVIAGIVLGLFYGRLFRPPGPTTQDTQS